jgi:hypothetical protein
VAGGFRGCPDAASAFVGGGSLVRRRQVEHVTAPAVVMFALGDLITRVWHGFIVKIVIVNTAGRRAVLNCQHELPKDWGMAMSTFTNQTSRGAIEARIAERRRADNGNELTMRANDDHYLPTAKAKAQVELVKWLCH